MTEAAYVFNETVAERADVKKSVARKGNGSAVAKLGNKPMSNKEIASKHGDCQTFKFGTFISRSEFEKMPNDLKAEYIVELCNKYDVKINQVSKLVFNWGDDGLKQHLRNNNILYEAGWEISRAGSGYNQMKTDFLEWQDREEKAKLIDLAEAKRKKEIIANAEFVSYDEYKSWKIHDQINYINNLIMKYSVGTTVIGPLLWGLSPTTIRDHFKHFDEANNQIKSGKKGPSAVSLRAKFDKAVKEWKGETVEEIKEDSVEEPIQDSIEEIAKDIIEEPVTIQNDNEETETCDSTNFVQIEDLVIKPGVSTTDVASTELDDDPMLYHDISFSSEYVAIGLDENELTNLIGIFKGKKVRVKIDITAL